MTMSDDEMITSENKQKQKLSSKHRQTHETQAQHRKQLFAATATRFLLSKHLFDFLITIFTRLKKKEARKEELSYRCLCLSRSKDISVM